MSVIRANSIARKTSVYEHITACNRLYLDRMSVIRVPYIFAFLRAGWLHWLVSGNNIFIVASCGNDSPYNAYHNTYPYLQSFTIIKILNVYQQSVTNISRLVKRVQGGNIRNIGLAVV